MVLLRELLGCKNWKALLVYPAQSHCNMKLHYTIFIWYSFGISMCFLQRGFLVFLWIFEAFCSLVWTMSGNKNKYESSLQIFVNLPLVHKYEEFLKWFSVFIVTPPSSVGSIEFKAVDKKFYSRQSSFLIISHENGTESFVLIKFNPRYWETFHVAKIFLVVLEKKSE
jgi:hypothetical protein